MGDLHKAAREGNLAELTCLLTAGQDVNVRDKLSRTPLHLAAWAGQVMAGLQELLTFAAAFAAHLTLTVLRQSASQPCWRQARTTAQLLRMI